MPPILKYSCTGLPCDNPPCYARRKQVTTACTHMFEFTNTWRYMGYQAVVYVNHESCDCNRCTDITSASSCTSTAPCPNEDNLDSFCYWTPTPSTASPVFNLGTVSPPTRRASLKTELPTKALPDAGVCQCCEPRPCPPNHVFVPERCQCECAVECPSDKVLDETTCKCKC